MPRLDGTGPEGKGSMTGRGMGSCNTGNPNGIGRGMGRGLGRGMGRGLGRGQGTGRGMGQRNRGNR